jgi:uncharacterized protein (TIGR00255 family)
MYSMTAFARATIDTQGHHLIWELKSVNHRFLETSFRMPEALRIIEHPLREHLRKRLSRGKVECNLRIEAIEATDAMALNQEKLDALIVAIEHVRQHTANTAPVDPLDLLRWPGVMSTTIGTLENLQAGVSDLFDKALDDLILARAREGDQLTLAIEQRLDQIDHLLQTLKPMTDHLALNQKNKLQDRLAHLKITLDSSRLEQEVALLAQRADVAEELDRLVIHVEEARNHLAGKGPHGRRLDFLTQELNREANTLGAKSVAPEQSQRAVDLKVLIEQIREQVQNVE